MAHIMHACCVGAVYNIIIVTGEVTQYGLATFIIMMVQKRWPSDKANHSCENTL